MTKLLEKAFTEASKLTKVEQNALAKWILEKLEAEIKWDEQIEADVEAGKLDFLADEALKEHSEGKTKPLNIKADLFFG
jgi:hypothetical protein